ncbi:MAG TPA: lytic transglycosylase domain-containing protein [Burkholderiales bacterium]|nr:lytic transglycosylase domain-containing protein [Burkholderiales bacterium]
MKRLVIALLLALPTAVLAGTQEREKLTALAKNRLAALAGEKAPPRLLFRNPQDGNRWLEEMSRRLEKRMPDRKLRYEFLRTLHFEAKNNGLDPQLVLALVEVESGFRKYAISSASARGYMQVMPFWTAEAGRPKDNLFHLRTNLVYGCWILGYYLDQEKNDLFRALGRYNGSLGKAEYPNLVMGAWKNRWRYDGPTD